MTARRYELIFRPAAVRQLRRLPKDAQRQIREATEALCDNPRPPGVKKLTGAGDQWRVRTGDYRVVYAVEDKRLVIIVVRVGDRRDVYRR